MGVIKRFAVSSIVLGTLAIAGGASALAFEGGADPLPGWPAGGPVLQSDVPAEDPVRDAVDFSAHVSSDGRSDVRSDVPSDVSSDVSPDGESDVQPDWESDEPADEAAEEELPETGGPDAAWGWFAPQGR